MAETSNPFFAKNKITEQGIIPSRGGGGPRVPGPTRAAPEANYYEDLKAQKRGRNDQPPEGGYEPGPYGDPVNPYLVSGPREAPTGMYGQPKYHGMEGEHFSVTKGKDGYYYCNLHNPEADPVGPFKTEAEAYDYFAPRGNQ